MLCNMGVHEDVLSVVQRPIEADKSVGPKGRSAVLCACYGFLRAFVRKNPVNQHLVYEQMDFMLSQMLLYAKDGDVPRAITECLAEVYRDNVPLCTLVSEQSLMPVPFTCHSDISSASSSANVCIIVHHCAIRASTRSSVSQPFPHGN
jgi:hypothetical protein